MPGRMEKIREGDPAITKNGVPIEEHIEEEERNELEKTRKEELVIKQKHKKKLRPRERYEDDPRRVSKRVHHLSDFEIRKEYGIMARPFKTLTQNVLYVLFNAGETKINSRAIADELNKQLPDVSSVLSGIWKKLKGDELIHREKVGLAYHYQITGKGLEMGFGPVFKKYFPGPGGQPGPRKKPEPKAVPRSIDMGQAVFQLLERVDKLESTELSAFDEIKNTIKKMRTEWDHALNRVDGKVNHAKTLVADMRQSLEDGLEDKAAAINPLKTPNEFNVNFNIRFLLR